MDKDSIKTASGHRFHATGTEEHQRRLFAVTPDVPIIDALNSVSCLLTTLEDGILDAAMGYEPLQDNAAWLTHHTLQSARAVVDSLLTAMESQQLATPGGATWRQRDGLVNYYILDEVHIQRAPFGKYGPFPTPIDLRNALDRLERKYPELVLVSRKACLASDMISDQELDDEHGKTLEKLRELGV